MSYGKKPKSTNKDKRRPSLKPRSSKQADLISCRSSFGSTEKILRRNRKTWTRKFAKEGRQIDKAEVQAGLSLTAEFPLSRLKLEVLEQSERAVWEKFFEIPWEQT
jgi:hypothetical protein